MLTTALLYAALAAALAADEVKTVARPDTSATNPFYPGNREPLLASPLLKLPVGAVGAQGWLRKQLELQAAGFHGHLGEISKFLVKENNAWLSPKGEGNHGWEELPYWLKGFGDCAYLLDNKEQIAEARVWIEGALASQRDDGYFGPRPGTKATVSSTSGKYDLWSNMVMLCCLQSYYEFTGDKRVIDLMTRYFRWELSVPEEEFLPPYWQQQRAGDNLWSVLWLYNRTGEPWLLDLAHKIHRRTANWSEGIPNWHNVNMSQAFGGPTYYWPLSKDDKYLAASQRNWQEIRDSYGQVPGGMFGGDENCRPGFVDPRQGVETCGIVEMMFSHERLTLTTGNLIWADRCEDVAFNSLPAALLSDMTALRYLTSPNLAVSDRHNKSPGVQNRGAMFLMNPHAHRCCQHNFGHGWPYFVEHLWAATPDAGLAAVLYGPCDVHAKVAGGTEVTIRESTRYPFEEQIELALGMAKPASFPLYLRIPGWCKAATLSIQGKPVSIQTTPLGYLRIARTWSDGDRLVLKLPMPITLRRWEKNQNSVSVDRGPLTYSLRIGEKYERQGGTDDWPAWEIHPTTPWNYGLVLDDADATKSFRVVQRDWPDSDMPFTLEGVPVTLVGRGKQIPEWQLDRHGLVAVLQPSPVKSDQPTEEITLVPMGAARLRIAAFPVIGDGPNARTWKAPPPGPKPHPYRASASHCHKGDTVDAVKDQLLPSNSNDHGIPRFTWWDHRGTQEWVQYDFPSPRKVSSVEVYWFDDEPRGQCRLPAAWKVLYRDREGDAWREVRAAKTDPIAKNKFNRTTFEPVDTTALRLEVQLQAKHSGGILEWKVE